MNEQYLRGYFESYVLPNKPDAVFEDWVGKISANEQYKQGMFNTYVKPSKPDADYNDWNSKIFGTAPQAPIDPRVGAIAENEALKIGNPILQAPLIGDFAIDAGRQIASVATDMIPQQIATLRQKGVSARRQEYEQLLSNPELMAAAPESQAYFEQQLPELKAKQLELEGEVALQKQDAATKLAGNVQELTEIGSVKDFAKWLGNSIGQAAGQIPLSAATFGGASFLMEAAEVYDQQLDLIAESNGITREEVIKRGLDDPAEGELFAFLAGALDAFSAGSIMKVFKGLAGKEIKKNLITRALKNSLGEALTEGSQGQLETLGATQGAGTEFNWDWKKFINEAAAGAVGAAGLSTAIDLTTASPEVREIQQIEQQLDAETSTGDPELDAAIDMLSADDSDAVSQDLLAVDDANKVLKVWAKEEQIQGAKFEEERAKEKKQLEEARKAQLRAERKQFIAEKLLEFEQSAALPRNLDPVSQSLANQELEAELVDVPTTIDPTTGKIVMTPKPVVEPLQPQTQEPVVQPVAQPTPVVEKPTLKKQEKPITPVQKKIAKVKEAKVKEPKVQPIEPLVKPVSEKAKQKLAEEIEDQSVSLRNKAAGALQSYAKRPKMLLERLEALVQKAEKANLPDVAREIEELRVKQVERAEKSAEKRLESKELAAKRKARVMTKEERAAQREQEKAEKATKRAASPENKLVTVPSTPTLGKQFTSEKTITLGKARDLYLTEIAKRVFKERGQVKIQEAIDAYKEFRQLNNLKELSDEQVRKKAEAYLSTARKDIEKQGRLNTLDKEAAKKLGLTLEDYRAIKPDLKAAEAKGITLKEYLAQKEEAAVKQEKFDEKKALDDFKKALQGDLDLDGPIDDVSFVNDSPENFQGRVNKYLANNDLSKYEKREISEEQYIALAPRSQHPILRALFKIVNRYKGKQGAKTKFITVTVPTKEIENWGGLGGFHASSSSTDSAYIVIPVNENGVPLSHLVGRNAVLHEALHDYTKLMFTRAFSADKGFKSEIQKTFFVIKNQLIKQTSSLINKILKGQPLTKREENLSIAISKYINPFFRTELVEGMDPDAVAEAMYNGNRFYAMTDVEEFLSEAFSDPNTVAFLSSVETDELISRGIYKGERKSLLYRWFEDLFDYVKEKFNFTPSENNLLNYALDTIVSYDVEFNEKDLARQEEAEFFEILSITNDKLDQPAPTKKEVKANKEIVKNITNTLWKRKEITSENDVLAYVKKVNARLPENKKLGDVYATLIYKKIKDRRDEFQALKKQKELLDSYLKTSSEVKTFTKKRIDDLKDFSEVDLRNIDYEDLNKFMRAYSNLFYNGQVDKASYQIMINRGKALKAAKVVKEIAPKLSKATNWMGMVSQMANPATFSSIISKYADGVSDKFLNTFFGGLMKSIAQSKIEAHNFFKELSAFAEKNNLVHNNLVKIGMYGGIFSTIAEPGTEAWATEVLENAEHNLKSAKNKLEAKQNNTYRGYLRASEIKQEIEIAQALLNKIKEKTSMEKLLSPVEEKFYQKIRDFAKRHENDFFLNTEAIWGNKGSQRRYNYFPTLAQGKVASKKLSDYDSDELIRTGAESLSEALQGKDFRYTDLYSKKVWSNYKRFNPEGYYYEYDAMGIGKNWSNKLLYDIYASKEIKALDSLMRSSNVKKDLGDLHPVIMSQLKSIVQSTQHTDTGLGPIGMWAMKIKDSLYLAALATGGQVLLQASSGIVGAAVLSASMNPVNAGKNFAKAVEAAFKSVKKGSKFVKFLEDEGMGIQLRDIAFENYLSPDDYRKFTWLSKKRKAAENATEWALRTGDKFAARLVWFAAYFDAGGTIENPSKEAILKAERTVGLMQNMSDLSFAAPIFKTNGSLAKKFLLGMFYAYKSFATNAYISMWTAAPKMYKSSEARKVFAAQLGSVIAYHALSILLIKTGYKAIAGAFDGEDDEEEEKTYSKAENITTNAFWDATVGMIAPTFVDQGARWLFNETAAPILFADNTSDFDKFLDSPLFSPARLDNTYKSLLGPGFREGADIWEQSLKVAALKMSNDADMAMWEEQAKYGAAKTDLAFMTMNTLIGMAAIVPLRGDFKRILEIQRKKLKNDARKELELMRSGGSGTINDGEYSDFTFPDYSGEEALEDFSFEEFLENE